MKAIRSASRSTPAVIVLVTIAAYGLLLPVTGFYWDDWPFAWIAHFLGPAEFLPAFRGFRPFLGPIFFLTTSLIPADPRLWQILALGIRCLSGIAAWFALGQIWPGYRLQTTAVALLFLVFPGYSQHWVAFTHINQEWISLISYLLSFGLTARAVRQPGKYVGLTIAALALQLIGVFPTEYFIGLEPLRFLFIWAMLAEPRENLRGRLVHSLKYWWPYLVFWIGNLAWLAYYYRSGAYVSYDLTAVQAAPAFSQVLVALADTLWKGGLYVWVQVLILLSSSPLAPTSLITGALIAFGFSLVFVHLRAAEHTVTAAFKPQPLEPDDAQLRRTGFAVPAIVIGAIGLLLGRVPSLAAGLPLTLQSSYDRFMISMMLGASLLVTGLVELLVRDRRIRVYMLAALIALGIGQQFYNANIFRRDWQRQLQIYWQLAWRIPSLPPGTAIVAQQMPLDYETDLSMTAAVNWMYAQRVQPPDLPYALVYSEKRLGGVVLPDLGAGTAIYLPFRTMEFLGNTSRVVVIYVPPTGCLRVLDPALDDQATYSRFPASVTAPIALSRPDLIETGAPARLLPNPPFGSEPPHTWCYFYEKAELARQIHDWDAVAAFGAEATAAGSGPRDAFEWLPFIEGYARTGRLSTAAQISRDAWDQDPRLHRGLCVLWSRLRQDPLAQVQVLAAQLVGQFACGQ